MTSSDQASDDAGAEARRPRLLLDVDGVLNAFEAFEIDDPSQPATYENMLLPDHFRVRVVNGFVLALNPAHVGWLRELEAHFEIIWTTMWEHHAPTELGPVLGIGTDWPYVDFAQFHDEVLLERWGESVGHYKFPGVVAVSGDLPMVWIDDDLHADQYEWAAERDAMGIPTMLVQPSPATGWIEEEFHEVLAFATRLRGD